MYSLILYNITTDVVKLETLPKWTPEKDNLYFLLECISTVYNILKTLVLNKSNSFTFIKIAKKNNIII